MRRFVLIPAAGTGSRVAATLPKQYLPLGGQPLLTRTLAVFCQRADIAGIYVVVAPDDTHYTRAVGVLDKVEVLRRGGASRAETVKNGLDALAGIARIDDWVLVHDAARPCLTQADLDRLMREVGEDPVGGLLALPVADTLKRADTAARVHETVPRAGLWAAQTPQMFRYGLLRQALAKPGALYTTDESQAIEAFGLAPKLVLGNPRNLKVTYAEDLVLADRLIERAEGCE